MNSSCVTVKRLAGFSITAGAIDPLAAFYERALGFRRLASRYDTAAKMRARMDLASGATCATLALGEQRLELVQFDLPGQPYPLDTDAASIVFQHLAIVVTDMHAAYARLQATDGWTAISQGGPVQLPESSGGVTAFKFRDPEGHPLELLEFPAENTPKPWQGVAAEAGAIGIDHSAISVADTQRSVAFYKALGLDLSQQGVNQGETQRRLDHLSDAYVTVTAMKPRRAPPHVELLGYRQGGDRAPLALHDNDLAATRLVFEAAEPMPQPLRRNDLDGHHLVILPPGADLAAG